MISADITLHFIISKDSAATGCAGSHTRNPCGTRRAESWIADRVHPERSGIKDIPIWTFHGKLDGTVPYLGTEKMANTLKELGGNCRFTLYPTMEHGIWPTVYAREDILPWLLSKKLSDRMEETTAVEEESTGLPEPTTGSTEQPSPKRSSCRSAVIGAAPVAGAVVISAFALKKKKED